MHQAFELSAWASDVGTVDSSFIFFTRDGGVARWTTLGHPPRLFVPCSLLGNRCDDLGDYFPRPLHLHPVADAKVFADDQIFVVQGRELDDHSANLHWLQN